MGKDPDKDPSGKPNEELFAFMAQAEEHAKAAEAQRRAVDAGVVSLDSSVKRMNEAVQGLAATNRLLTRDMEAAAKAAFSNQADEIVRTLRFQVEESARKIDDAAGRAARKVFVTRWSELCFAFLLGGIATALFGYFEIKKPLDQIWNAQNVLYEEIKKVETEQQKLAKQVTARPSLQNSGRNLPPSSRQPAAPPPVGTPVQ